MHFGLFRAQERQDDRGSEHAYDDAERNECVDLIHRVAEQHFHADKGQHDTEADLQ